MTNEQMPQPQPGLGPQPAPTPAADPRLIARRRFSAVGVALLVMVGLWIVLVEVFNTLVVSFWPTHHIPGWVAYATSGAALYLIAMPVARLILGTVPALPTRRFKLGARRTFELFAICLPIMVGGNIIGTLLSSVISGGQSSNRIVEAVTTNGLISNALYMVVLAPILEEWLFRKQIIDRTRVYGERTAILLSALAFALFHLNLYQFFYAFGIGILFAYVYTRTSMLRYSWLLHALINFNGAVLAPLMLRMVESMGAAASDPTAMLGMSSGDMMQQLGPGWMVFSAYGLLIIGLLIAGIVLLITRWRRREFYIAPLELPRGTAVRTAFVNPGMLGYVIVALALSLRMTM